MNVFSTENRLNDKWVLLAGKLLPGLALVLLFLILPTAASAQFTCPPTDQLGFAVGQTNTATNPIFCSYPAVPGEDPNDFFCTYNQTTGVLVTDNDAGLCQATAVGAPPPMPPTFAKTITTPFGVINQGDVAQVTFTITNPTAGSLTGLAFSDVLPAGLQVQSSPVSNTCGGTATADPGTNTISLTAGTLAGSSSCTITANVIGQASGSQTNPSVTLASSAGPATATAVTVFVYPWWLVFFY